MASNGDISDITQIVCFIVITLHFLAGPATSWCDFLLKVFIFLLEVLGRADIAEQNPLHLFTACTYSGVPSYNVTTPLVCPACRDVFHIGDGTPIDHPRCSIPLYSKKHSSNPPTFPFPTPHAGYLSHISRTRICYVVLCSLVAGIYPPL